MALSESILSERCLEQARGLVSSIESGDEGKAVDHLREISRLNETKMFQEIGRLTRELHDTLVGFGIETEISELAEHEIPDARERLSHVINVTDQAAHKTLTAVEEAIPVCSELEASASHIEIQWKRFISRDLSADEFRELSREIGSHLEISADRYTKIKLYLNDILMAQDFQDITGQIIRRVITLVQDVEDKLVGLIKLSGDLDSDLPKATKKPVEKVLEGPQVPGKESATALKSQDEVDDLLSSLGF
ncbi:MAG TPA: protein phosphatase CheZ [Chromatiales bacterium]|nr:protein phosphatase CheZ [Chromatiales bacterium]